MFQQFRISTRLMVSFLVTALVMLAVLLLGLQQMGVIKSSLASINDVNGVKQRYAINFRGSVHDRAIVLRDVVAIKDDGLLTPELATIQRLAGAYAESAQKLDALMSAGVGVTPQETELLAAVKATEQRTMPLITQVIALRQAQKHDEALALLMGQARPQFVQWLADINKLIDFEEAKSTADGTVARAVADNFLMLVSGAFAMALALSAWVTWRVSLSIVTPLKAATDWTHEVAQGDLSRPIRVEDAPTTEIGRMISALQGMNQGLAQLVGTVRETSVGIASGVREIASGNTDLSQRTEAQVSHLQETHSAMQSFTESLRQSSEMATQARALATHASTSASDGGQVVQSVVQTMNDITLASRKISDIISVIDGIAFQTNILALNAAVEAARAGEQGRGFAVVAGEVRLLAQRSANAAKEIKGLIQASVDRVDAGARLVDSAGQAMSGIVTQVKQVSDLIASISDAAAEQTSSIAVVERSMTNLDQTSQQNSALVEENAAAAESLSEQAQRLNGLMAVFRLRDASGRLPAGPSDSQQAAAQVQSAIRRSSASAASSARSVAHSH